MTNEEILLKMNLLGGMTEYIKNYADEELQEVWQEEVTQFSFDTLTEDTLSEIAQDNELWNGACDMFSRIVFVVTREKRKVKKNEI